MKPRKIKQGKKIVGYLAVIHVEVDGRRTTRSYGRFAKERDAQDKMNVELAKARRGEWLDPARQRVTVKDWAERWYAARLRPSRKYRALLDARILPKWGPRICADLTQVEVAAWVKEMTDVPLSAETVRAYYTLLKQILADAQEEGIISRTPCRLRPHQLPTVERSEHVFLTTGQAAMLVALAPLRYRALVHLGFWSGLRIGELMALQWDCVDLEAGVMHVRRAVKKDGTIGLPKGDKTRRVLIDVATIERLRAHRRDFGASEWVFSTDRGGRIDYDNFRRRVWDPMVKTSQLTPAPTIHDMRHTHCGLMIAQGMDWLVLSDRMGHHKPSFTMDVYGHLRHDADEVVLAALAAAAAT